MTPQAIRPTPTQGSSPITAELLGKMSLVSSNAFRKFDENLSRRDIPIIARRFNAGIVVDRIRVPKGRLNVNRSLPPLSRPFGTLPRVAYIPALKRWAYFHLSLRDIHFRISERHEG